MGAVPSCAIHIVGKLTPLKVRVCLGRAPQILDSCFADWVWLPVSRALGTRGRIRMHEGVSFMLEETQRVLGELV